MKRLIKFLSRLLLNPSFSLEHKLFNLASFSVMLGVIISAVLSLFIGSNPVSNLLIIIVCLLSFFSLYASLHSASTRTYKISCFIFIFVADIFILPVLYFFAGGQGGGSPIWFLVGLIAPMLMVSGKIGYILYTIGVIAASVTFTLEYLHPEWVMPYETRADYTFDLIQSTIVVSLIFGLIYKFQNYQYEKQRKQLEERDNELLALHEGLQAEVDKQTKKAQDRREKVERISKQTMKTLAKAIDAKDNYTKGHSIRVAWYSRELARRMGLSTQECDNIYNMGLLHDIGKIGIPDHIINKPSKLTNEEYEIIKTHPVTGDGILREMTEMKGIETGARWHHERYDGKGYPDRLIGTEIPLFARIIGVADAYDAMTSNRSYRKFLPQEEVRRQILEGKGTQFDPGIADEMLKMIDDDKSYQLKEESTLTFE